MSPEQFDNELGPTQEPADVWAWVSSQIDDPLSTPNLPPFYPNLPVIEPN